MKDGWSEESLGSVCQIRPPKSEAREQLGPRDLVSFVPMANLMTNTKTVYLDQDRPLEQVAGNYTYFAENDVLLAKITPCFENRKLGLARGLTNGIGFGSSEFIVFRTNGELSPDYLYHYLSQDSFREAGTNVMTGAVGHKRVPKEFINSYLIPIPPFSEQEQIVATLDRCFEAIDKAKANVERNLQNAKDLFQSQLNQIFTQKGEGWVEKKLGEVCEVLNGYAFKSKDTIKESNTQLMRMGNLYQNRLDLGRKPVYYPDRFADEYKEYVLTSGDLVMSLTGTVDKTDYGYTVAIPDTSVDLLLNQRIMKLTVLDVNVLVKAYLHNYLLSPMFLEKLYATANGTRQANLSSKTILSLEIPFPSSIKTQMDIIVALGSIKDQTQSLESKYQQELDALDELKKSILQKAFNGELTEMEEAVA